MKSATIHPHVRETTPGGGALYGGPTISLGAEITFRGRKTPIDIVMPSDLPLTLISGHSQDRGNPKVDGSGGLMRQTAERYVLLDLHWPCQTPNLSHREKRGPISQREYCQRQECGRGIMKDLLDMTLIAVSLTHYPDTPILS